MSQFQEKVFAACAKKILFDRNSGPLCLAFYLAGAYLTMSTAVGIIGADIATKVFQPFLVSLFALSLPWTRYFISHVSD